MKWLEYYDKSDNKISDNFQPSIPRVSQNEYNNIVVPHLIKWGAIPKSQLTIGKTYKGYCRNASEATWNGKVFVYNAVGIKGYRNLKGKFVKME